MAVDRYLFSSIKLIQDQLEYVNIRLNMSEPWLPLMLINDCLHLILQARYLDDGVLAGPNYVCMLFLVPFLYMIGDLE